MEFVKRHPLLCEYAKDYGDVVTTLSFNDVFKLGLGKFHFNVWDMIYPLAKGDPNVPFTMRTPKGTKLNRILLEMFPEHAASINKLSEYATPRKGRLIVSVRKADIIRRGQSIHYRTCIGKGGGNHYTISHDCLNPDIAVAFIRDNRGQMLSRQTIRVGYTPQNKPIGVWLHTHSYGVYQDWPALLAKHGLPIAGRPKHSPGFWDGDNVHAIRIRQV